MRRLLGESDILVYLAIITVRLIELHRVLKPTGSLYLHCDTTVRHYLKVLLDAVFDPRNFVNEVIWKRSTAHNDHAQGAKHYGRLHGTLLVYATSQHYTWKQLY
jgi:adenine specific DNA methylase Mod